MMTCVLVIRVLLAAIFAIAGVAKLMDLQGTRTAVAGFGVPERFSTLASIAIPGAELAAAVLIVPASTAVAGGWTAIALLVLFSLAAVTNLVRGRRPKCHCFGQLHSAPIGPGLLVRNAVLIGLAVVIVFNDGGPSLPAWLSALDDATRVGVIVGAVAFAGLAIEGAVIWTLFAKYGQLLLRVDALSLNSDGEADGVEQMSRSAPEFTLAGLYGETMTLASLRARDRPVVLVFTDPNCAPCMALTPEIAVWQKTYESALTLAVVSRGTVEANRSKFESAGVAGVMIQLDNEVAADYQIAGTPSAILVTRDGAIASSVAAGAAAIRTLITEVTGSRPVPIELTRPSQGNGNGSSGRAAVSPLRIGDSVPEIVLSDSDHPQVELSSVLRGGPTALVFWNPGCGYCAQLEPQLREWEGRRGPTDPKMVLVSAGTVEDNKSLGFKSAVLHDQDFSVGPRFGATGTPIAVLIDLEGRVSSEPAVGGPAVLELLGGHH